MDDDLNDLKSTYDYDEQHLPSKDTVKDTVKDTNKDTNKSKSSASSTTPTIINNNNNNFNNKETIIERIIEKPIFINNNNNHSLQPSTLSSTDIKFNIIKPQPKNSFSHNINYSDSKETMTDNTKDTSKEHYKQESSNIKSNFKSNITNNKNTISISGIDVYASRVDSTKLDINPVSLAVNMLSNNKNVVSILNNKMSIVVNGTILDKINYLISFVLQDRLGQKSLISDLVNAVINETTENKIDYNSVPRIIIVIIDLLNNSMERTYLRIITKRDIAIFIKLFFIVLIEAKIIFVKFDEKSNFYKLFDDCIELLQRKIRVNKRSIFWWMTCCCSGCCGYKTWGCM